MTQNARSRYLLSCITVQNYKDEIHLQDLRDKGYTNFAHMPNQTNQYSRHTGLERNVWTPEIYCDNVGAKGSKKKIKDNAKISPLGSKLVTKMNKVVK